VLCCSYSFRDIIIHLNGVVYLWARD